MPLVSSDYSAPLFLPNGHLQTIYPALFRKTAALPVQRERISTPDNDFIDIDWTFSMGRADKLVILTHGLEGSSGSPYILGMKKHFLNLGFDTLAWNFRGCSGEINRSLRFYHSGETGDLEHILAHALNSGKYRSVFLIGFSLGGNVLLKFLGEKSAILPKEVRAAVAISVPCHLASAASVLARWQNTIYLRRFLKSLRNKIRQKAAFFPSDLDCKDLDRIRDFLEFDNHFTAPLHGFADAAEYWEKSSSRQYIPEISIPVLLLNARNDPFLSEECFPYKEAADHGNFYLETPKQGGHCSFYLPGKVYYSEKRAGEFVSSFTD